MAAACWLRRAGVGASAPLRMREAVREVAAGAATRREPRSPVPVPYVSGS